MAEIDQDDALLNPLEQRDLQQEIALKLHHGKQYWWPLHARMDYWSGMYFMLDVMQQMKPLGYRRFITNEPRTAVDTSVSIMTRNDSYWRGDTNDAEMDNQDGRRRLGKVERVLQGLIYDADELFSMTGQMPFWKQAAYQALLRGWVWAKAHITTTALEYRSSPLLTEIFDSRLVYPHFDQYGLNYALMEKHTTLGDLLSVYPEAYPDELRKKGGNPNQPAVKVEYWSNTRGEREGVTGVLAVVTDPKSASPLSQPVMNLDTIGANGKWLIPPYRHGYHPDQLPVFGVPVNGVPIQLKPGYSTALDQVYESKWHQFGFDMRFWQGPHTAVAESGRSILSSVEEQIPQFNELVATIFQYFSMTAFPTKIFKTQTGELPEFEEGINAHIPLRPEESVENLQLPPISSDAYRLLQLLQDEQAKGTLSNVLRATTPFGGGESGIFFQQVTNAALNGLEPYQSGLVQLGTRMSSSILGQMQAASSELKKFTVSVPLRPNTYFRVDVDFDPKEDLARDRKYRIRPIFRPSLPDDMHIRIQTARVAIDPARPVLSVLTVLEKIIQVEDPTAEMDRIWEDVANRDPVIVLEQIAQSLERMEEPELAARIREAQFRTRFMEEMQFRQASGQGALPAAQGPPNTGPETGNPQSTQRTSPNGGAGLANEGAAIMSAIGQGGGT